MRGSAWSGWGVRPIISVTLVITITWLGLSATAPAFFDSRVQSEKPVPVTLDRAVAIAEASVPGKAIEAKLGQEDGRAVYQIVLIDSLNQARLSYVDAQSGKVLAIKEVEVIDGAPPFVIE